MGPLMTAFLPCAAKPNDIAFTPSYSIGIISLGLSSWAWRVADSLAINVGRLGP